MPINIVDSLLNSSKDLIGPLTSSLGASEGTVKSAMNAAIPALLGGLMQKASTTQGASELFQLITAPSIDAGVLSNPQALTNPDSAASLTSLGNNLLSKVFGDRAGQIAESIGSVVGLKASSASSLLAIAASMLFAFLKKQVTAGNLGASGLSDLLLGQKGFLERMGLDSRITRAFGFGSLSGMLDAVPSLPAAAMQSVKTAAAGTTAAAAAAASVGSSGLRRALPWLIGALVIALIYFGLMRPRPAPTPMEAPPLATVPSAQTGAPGTALRESVYFDVGQTALGPDSQTTLTTFAERIKQAGVKVNITGYTDATGDPVKNAELAKERAQTVRGALLAAGVAESSINLQPPASITGGGSATEARRVDIAQAQ